MKELVFVLVVLSTKLVVGSRFWAICMTLTDN